MTELFENWRDYQETQEANQFVQDIWEGKFLESSPIIYEANGDWYFDNRLDEGLWNFMKSVVSWGKSKYEEFNDWAESKLQKVVDAAIEKIQEFLQNIRSIIKKMTGKVGEFLNKLFGRNRHKRVKLVLGALRLPKYLAIGATLLSMLLQKVAKMGLTTLLDSVATAGAGTASKIAIFISNNIDKFQTFMDMIWDFLDPNGIVDTVENLGILADSLEILDQFKEDVRKQAFKEDIMENLLETLTDEQLTEIVRSALIESGKCQKGYKTHPTRKTKEMFGKQYRNCIKADEALRTRVRETIMRRLQEEGGCYSDKEICTAGLKFVVNSESPGIKDVKCEDGVLKNWSARAAQIASKYCKDDNYGKGKKKNESKVGAHMMYDPKTGDAKQAKNEDDHNKLAAKGYVHVDPDKIRKALEAEGGASGTDAVVDRTNSNEKEVKKAMDAMPDVAKHKKGDYIIDDDENIEVNEGDLQKWADEKWVHSDGTPCGDGRGDGSVERCKPKAKWAKMSKGEKAADNAKKRAGTKKGKQNVAATKKGKVTKSYTKR